MTDDELVEQTALDFIRTHREEAVPRLLERAEIDALLGNHFSAEAWLDIAEAAWRLTSGSER